MTDSKTGEEGHREVLIIMGSQSDWETMQHACNRLAKLGIDYQAIVASAHRTPDRVREHALLAFERGFKVVIAGAGKAAALPGAIAPLTMLPVLGVPMEGSSVDAEAALYSMSQIPTGTPVGTFGHGKHGAENAALHAARTIALIRPELLVALREFQRALAASVPLDPNQPK